MLFDSIVILGNILKEEYILSFILLWMFFVFIYWFVKKDYTDYILDFKGWDYVKESLRYSAQVTTFVLLPTFLIFYSHNELLTYYYKWDSEKIVNWYWFKLSKYKYDTKEGKAKITYHITNDSVDKQIEVRFEDKYTYENNLYVSQKILETNIKLILLDEKDSSFSITRIYNRWGDCLTILWDKREHYEFYICDFSVSNIEEKFKEEILKIGQ